MEKITITILGFILWCVLAFNCGFLVGFNIYPVITRKGRRNLHQWIEDKRRKI